ncbi:metal-dependent hydrolase, beta-lactamase superfamily III [SAR116 cluster alpha proteobacterium HIMB100]|nr:metal-dependent hydrolase, beta-lactamase superfamily III [SAR116 cluster alpha proteobacterium HIMB100]
MENKVVLFGTKGGPRLIKGGSWPTSSALVLNDKVYIIDAGLGVTRQFIEAGFTYDQLETVFITHHHSDHNLELGGLVYTSWVGAPAHHIKLFGPHGLNRLMTSFVDSQAFDIDIRVHDEGLNDIRNCFSCHEFTEGVVFEDDHLIVQALRVKHPPVTDCFALKFETETSKIVFGADTAYFPPLAEFARDADILVHEAMHLGGAKQICDVLKDTKPKLWDHFMASHTPCEDVGRIATSANCKTLVVNHFVPEIGFRVSKDEFETAIRSTFAGNLVLGKDLLSIPF